MHIAINALSITNRSGTDAIPRADSWLLSDSQPDFKLSIIIPADFPIPSARQHSTQFRFYSIPVRSTFSRIRWEQFSLPRLLRQIQTDALHSPAFIAPVVSDLRIPGVVTIHDLTFERYPSLIPALRRPYYRWAIPKSIRTAQVLLTDSVTIAEELAQRLTRHPPIIPIHLGVDPVQFSPLPQAQDQRILHKYGIPSPYFLTVGTREPRVSGYHPACLSTRTSAELKISGHRRTSGMDAQADAKFSHTHFPDSLDEDPALYRHAQAFSLFHL